ncbi:MAG: bifunctional oligoribonuclease/PAP phosphatase NrnA [Calditrichia bacterium]
MQNKKTGMEQIVNFIRQSDNFLVTTHLHADGDAYASALAVAFLLDRLNKKYRVVLDDESPDPKYSYLWGFDKIESYREDLHPRFDNAIVLDVPSKARMGKPAKLLPRPANCLKIDHHPEEDNFAAFNLVDVQASSTSQLVYLLLKAAGIELTRELAALVFTGIMFDTGRFSFSNTRQIDFEIAAEMMRFGIIPSDIANRMFFNNSIESMNILGYALSHLNLFLEGKLAIIYLPPEITRHKDLTEIEELANYTVSIRNVEVGLFIREIQPGEFKVSFRSKGNVNVNTIARKLGGGGHRHAAGCRYSGNYDELKMRLMEEVAKQL